jgi:hypothetical protein
VQELSPEELAEFRVWFLEYDADMWDQQIAADLKSGKLDELIAEARADLRNGKAREL